MIAHLKCYRRWRGGRWAKVTGWLWGKRWIKVPPECWERVDEDYENANCPSVGATDKDHE